MNNGPPGDPDPYNPGLPPPGIYAPVNTQIGVVRPLRDYVGGGAGITQGYGLYQYEFRTVGVGNPGILDPATAYADGDDGPKYYLNYSQGYTISSTDIDFTIDPHTRVTSPDPRTQGTPTTAPHNFSNEYTMAQVIAATVAAVGALPWRSDGQTSTGDPLTPSFNGSSGGCTIVEARWRFGYQVYPDVGNATVRFRFRTRSAVASAYVVPDTDPPVLALDYIISYSEEMTNTLSLGPYERPDDGSIQVLWTEWNTILADAMANHTDYSVIGPGDTSYLTPGVAITGFAAPASKLQTGFRAYITQAATAGVVPETAVYELETASAGPGATGEFSGTQDDTGDHFSPDVPYWAKSIPGGTLPAPNDANARIARQQLATLTPTERTFRNGLVMTLSNKIETADVLAALTDYLEAAATRSPSDPLPTAPRWLGGHSADAMGNVAGNPAYEIARNWVSADGVQFERQRARYAVRLEMPPISQWPHAGHSGDIPVSWDVTTVNLLTGERGAPVTQTATYHYDTSPGAPGGSDVIHGPETTALPDPGTAIEIGNFRVGPGLIAELEDSPVFEVTPGR